MEFNELYEIARNTLNPRAVSQSTEAGHVAAALVTEKGNVYKGVNIDAPCGMGFCAEHSAIAAMITAGESRIKKIVAVYEDGAIWPPCGRCREFIYQINNANKNCVVMLEGKTVPLSELLPDTWN